MSVRGKIEKVVDRAFNILVVNAMFTFGRFCRRNVFIKSKNASKTSKKLLMKQLKKSRNTVYGKKYDFANIKSVREYQDKVPFSTYEDYQELIDRTANTGEQNLITGNKIRYFATTSGTIKKIKLIPVISQSYTPYLKCASIIFANLRDELRKRYCGIQYGKGMNLIECGTETTPSGIKAGFISGYAVGQSLAFLPAFTCLPRPIFGCNEPLDMKYVKARYALQDGNITYMMAVFMSALTDIIGYIKDNREMLIHDIETGTIDKSIVIPADIRRKLEKKLYPDPKRAAEIRKAFENPSDRGIVCRLWKRVSLIIGIGTGEFTPFETKMRLYCDNRIPFNFEMYAASEALFATTVRNEDKNYLMIGDCGFYEFIPEDDENARPLLINELEVGKNYEIVVTNTTGLYRYRIKDVIKVTGYSGESPYIQFAYRKEQIINLDGIHLTMEHAVETMKKFETVIKNHIYDYSLFADNDYNPARVIVFIETAVEIPNNERLKLGKLFDETVAIYNPEYGISLGANVISGALVYCVKRGTYKRFRDSKIESGKAVNQIKTVRVITNQEQLEFFMNSIL